MTFNIHKQNAGQINMAGRDMTICGDQHATVIAIGEARNAVRELQEALAGARLEPSTAAAARTHIDVLDAEMRPDNPDKASIASHLRRLADLLSSTGSLVGAGAAIVGPLQTLATWLGHLGTPITHTLGLL